MRFILPRDNPRQCFSELDRGLTQLNFVENFTGFEWKGEIESASEVAIRNIFRDGTVPRGYLVTMVEGTNAIVKGDTEWTHERVSLKNIDAALKSTLTVFFYR